MRQSISVVKNAFAFNIKRATKNQYIMLHSDSANIAWRITGAEFLSTIRSSKNKHTTLIALRAQFLLFESRSDIDCLTNPQCENEAALDQSHSSRSGRLFCLMGKPGPLYLAYSLISQPANK